MTGQDGGTRDGHITFDRIAVKRHMKSKGVRGPGVLRARGSFNPFMGASAGVEARRGVVRRGEARRGQVRREKGREPPRRRSPRCRRRGVAPGECALY